MNQPAITVIINGTSYRLSTSNIEAIRSMPNADRQQLITLLEALKHQEGATQTPARPAPAEPTHTAYNPSKPTNPQTVRPERLSGADVDTLMAQLIMEERSNQKPGLTKQTIYKWIAGVTVVVILLIVMS